MKKSDSRSEKEVAKKSQRLMLSNRSNGNKIRKRRKIEELSGESHYCKHCGMKYFSGPALYTHLKLMHRYIEEPVIANKEIQQVVN